MRRAHSEAYGAHHLASSSYAKAQGTLAGAATKIQVSSSSRPAAVSHQTLRRSRGKMARIHMAPELHLAANMAQAAQSRASNP